MSESSASLPTDQIFRCLLFDLGNTLWYADKQKVAQQEARTNLDAISILRQADPTGAFLREHAVAEAGALLRAELLRQFRQTIAAEPAIEPAGPAMVQQALLAIGWHDADAALCEALFAALQISMEQSRVLFADTIATLQALRQRNIPLGIVSNRHWGGASLYHDLRNMGLLDYFEYAKVAISADLAMRKPAPDIFLYALHACDADPKTTLMVGDSLTADVAGSQQLGLCAAWMPVAYAEVQAYLESQEHLSVAEYNRRQLALFRAGEYNEYVKPDLKAEPHSHLELFARGTIRPQLIIKNLDELLSWL